MDDFLIVVFLFFLIVLILPLIFSIVALVKSANTRKLFEDRLHRLEIQGDWFRGRLKELDPRSIPKEEPAEPEVPAAPVEEEEESFLELDESDMTPPEPPAAPTTKPIFPKRKQAPIVASKLPPSAAPPPPSKPKAPAVPFDWERWIGVRGAALLGGIVLAIAALMFFKYSLDQGWISRELRVVVGVLAGLAGLVGAEFTRKRGYRVTSDAITGASVVALYAAFWAAGVRYELVPNGAAWVLMIMVTAAACILSIRHHSLVIAVLGLVGGFATPLLLSTGSDQPIGLFGYVLLLDLGLLAVAKKRRWPSLGVLSLIATVLMQGLWIFVRMGPDTAFIGLIVLGVFAGLFGVVARTIPSGDRAKWMGTQAAAMLLPFGFALYFASRIDLGPHLAPVGILLVILSAGAGWVARAQKSPWLAQGAAIGSVSVVGVWMLRARMGTDSLAWELVGMSLLLALVFHAFVEWDRRRENSGEPLAAALMATFGLFICTLVAYPKVIFDLDLFLSPWPYVTGWLALTLLVYRQAMDSKWPMVPVVAGALLGFGTILLGIKPDSTGAETLLITQIGLGVLLLVVPLFMKGGKAALYGWHGAGTYLMLTMFSLLNFRLYTETGVEAYLGAALLVAVLMAFAAALCRSGGWHLVGVLGAAYVHLVWANLPSGGRAEGNTLTGLIFMTLGVLITTAWPFFAKALRTDRWAIYGAALAGPAWFFPMKEVWEKGFGSGAIGALPVGLGVISFCAFLATRQAMQDNAEARKRALVWFSAVAMSFITAAIPLQLDKEWITIGWALQGAAILALWRKLEHPGLKYFGLALLTAVTGRLIANPAILDYYVDMGPPIVNWLAYTYLIPAACLLLAYKLLKPVERERARAFELQLYAKGWTFWASTMGLFAVLVVFAWINLAIQDYYSTGPGLQISFTRMPARDTTLSVAWAIYALALLALGMLRNSKGLRWLSLGFLLLTIGKVFLHDLGELKDLYRVASLLGLAISLILVSFAYQRFVFGKDADQPPEDS